MSTSLELNDSESLDLYRQLESSLQNAKLGLVCVFGAASLGLGVGGLTVRRRAKFSFDELPQWNLIAFLFANLLFAIFISVSYGVIATGIQVTEELGTYNQVARILPFFFLYAGNCCLLYILYCLVHLFLTRCPFVRASSPRVEKFHWCYVGFIVILTIVEWGLLTKSALFDGNVTTVYIQSSIAYVAVSTAAYLIRLIASVEILAWTIYFVYKTIGKRSRWRALAVLLLIGSIFFFALILMWAVWDIRWLIWPLHNATNQATYSNAVDSARICETCFYLCIYVGLPSFYLRWGWLASKDKGSKSETKSDDEDSSGPAEADSQPRAELTGADAEIRGAEADSAPVFEADAARHIYEVDAARTVIVEADSKEVAAKPA